MSRASINSIWHSRMAFVVAIAAAVITHAPSPAFAQLFEIARAVPIAGGATVLAADIAYDPVHDRYLVISEGPIGGALRIVGHFTDRTGRVVAGPFDIAPHGWLHRVAYSPDVSDGIGGRGGFVVITGDLLAIAGELNAQIVSYPGRLVGSATMIFSAPPNSATFKVDIAYSPTARRFLVAVGVYQPTSRFTATASIPVRAIMLDLEAMPISDVPISPDPNPAPSFHEFYYRRNEIRAVWNPASDDFGVLFTYDNQRTLARVRSDGTVRGRTPLQLNELFGDLEVNTQTGHYLAIGGSNNLTFGLTRVIEGVEVSADGSTLARGAIVGDVCIESSCNQSTVIWYSPIVGTFLLVAASEPIVRFVELNQHGVALSSMSESRAPLSFVAAHPTANEWSLGDLILGSHSLFGGSDSTLVGCINGDPFTSLGGGVCVGRAWVPRGHPLAPPVYVPIPIPGPGACTTLDPFTSLGGGVCVSGGWVPRGHPLASGS